MKHQGMTFRHEVVRLDFGHFENCRFEDCTMVYGGYGPVAFEYCGFGELRWKFVDAAANTIGFMKGMYHGAGDGGRQLIDRTIEEIRRPPVETRGSGRTEPKAQ